MRNRQRAGAHAMICAESTLRRSKMPAATMSTDPRRAGEGLISAESSTLAATER